MEGSASCIHSSIPGPSNTWAGVEGRAEDEIQMRGHHSSEHMSTQRPSETPQASGDLIWGQEGPTIGKHCRLNGSKAQMLTHQFEVG